MEVSEDSIEPAALANFLAVCRMRVEMRRQRRLAQRRESLVGARTLALRRRLLSRLRSNLMVLIVARSRANALAEKIHRILEQARP